jgi:hypothetical protein
VQAACDFCRIGRLEKQLEGFDQVLSGRFDRVALAGEIELRAKSHVSVVLAFDDGSELSGRLHETDGKTGGLRLTRSGAANRRGGDSNDVSAAIHQTSPLLMNPSLTR